MSNFWEDLASRLEGVYVAEDFETAAYRLVSEQVIYHSDRSSRVSYSIVDLYEREFNKVLAPLGVSLTVNRQLRYVVAQPQHARASTATVAQTLFALVLRGLYEEGARAGDLSEEAEVMIDYIELQEKYRLMTGRDLPPKGELDSLLRAVRRWGIARRLDDDDSTELTILQEQSVSGIAIRPAIVEVLGETALMRLAQWEPHVGQEAGGQEMASAAQTGGEA
jgi:hypothetical protein